MARIATVIAITSITRARVLADRVRSATRCCTATRPPTRETRAMTGDSAVRQRADQDGTSRTAPMPSSSIPT